MLSDIIGQHAPSVGRTFKKFGINAPVNEDTLAAALIMHKSAFIGALAQDAENYSPNSFDGETKKTTGQKIKNTLLAVLGALGTGAAVIGSANAGTATNPILNNGTYYPPPAVEKKKPNLIAILSITLGVITAVALIIIFSKNK